ncbi:E3 ubiquitin-protein ligase RNF14-like [Thunnus albacares]|uniref:E3 ubiquitin-protein ligase RNF14-like n=1 Tax=Thunnus albacares TaxID=8236 RepID=UPI001CF714C6|nr:E3 ubiquitin-protein ligase RNF14-like [Thunnus albacares]
MNVDLEEQEDELLALCSILGSEEFVRDEFKSGGEIRVSVELPAAFMVALREGETLRQYEISFLPPLLLTFELPENYPSSSPPSFTLTCSWLTHTQLSALAAHLIDLYQTSGSAVVLFSWVQFLREDAFRFLDIDYLLELPSDEHNTLHCSQDTQNATFLEAKSNQDTPTSGSRDDQSCNVSETQKTELSAPSSEADIADSVALNSCMDGQNNFTSSHSKVSQNDVNSGPNRDYQKALPLQTKVQNTSNDFNQTSQTSDVCKPERIFQTSEFKSDHHNDLSSEADKSEFLPFAQSNQTGQKYYEMDSSASSWLPSSSSVPLGGEARPKKSPPNEDQSLSGLSLTPAQALLSQLLTYDAAQKQKVFASTVFDCGVCFTGWLGSQCVQILECGHVFCQACLANFCKLQITEGNVRGVTCPQADCTATPTPAQVKSLVGEELFSRYDRLLLQSTLDCMPDVVYCPRRSCGSAVIQEKASNAAMCSVCGFAFCVTCKKTYHGTDDCQAKKLPKKQAEKDSQQTLADLPQSQGGLMALWDDYTSGSKQRQRLLESRYGRNSLHVTVEGCLSEDWIAFNSKNCPHCFCKIQKNGGCNKMTCSQCRGIFCWSCLARLRSFHCSQHFQDGPCSAYEYSPN